ncbi:uncharacterized protein [Triticum aestivum]|uniref:uncharacterized protein isoform X2 n=1 Tax=Triticum aestivum TaxID=4565 RepID=UPI001D009F91|nr:uncharacterized protein LOC123096910 isoform X2 [Triticum aestivum]
MAASSSSSLRIPTPTHHLAVGACPRRLPFHVVSPQQAPAPGDGDDANGPTGVPVPFYRAGSCSGGGRRRRWCARRWTTSCAPRGAAAVACCRNKQQGSFCLAHASPSFGRSSR